jgi:hypothetical protein
MPYISNGKKVYTMTIAAVAALFKSLSSFIKTQLLHTFLVTSLLSKKVKNFTFWSKKFQLLKIQAFT